MTVRVANGRTWFAKKVATMADSVKATFDTSEWDALFDRLVGPARESLARRMGVSGGQVLRDEAKAQAPEGIAEEKAVRQFGGSLRPGALKNAIYLVFSDDRSTSTVFTYSISWNAKQAPHGHLLEFGHWQPYAVVFTEKWGWYTDKTRLLATPKWTAAHPFLAPAYMAAKARAADAMIARGRKELPGLLRGEDT